MPQANAHASVLSPPPERSTRTSGSRKERRPSATYSDDLTNAYSNDAYSTNTNSYAEEYPADYQYFSDKYSNAEYPPSGGGQYNQHQPSSHYSESYQAISDPSAQAYSAYASNAAYTDGQYSAYGQDAGAYGEHQQVAYARNGSDSEFRRQPRRP